MPAAELEVVIKADVNQATANMGKFNTAVTKTGQTINKVATKGGKDFTGLSRVIQDLPYGFNAISNNLTQLLPAAGLVGVAFSAIVSAVTLAQIGFGAWTRGLVDNKKALEDNAKAQEAIYSDAGKGISNVLTLTNAAKNLNLSMTERLAAVRKLQEEYPSYFGNLSKEKILNGDVANAIQDVTKALFNRAVVRQKESDLAPIAAQLFDLREQRKELEKQEATLKRMIAVSGRGRTPGGVTARLTGAGSQDKKAINDVTQAIVKLDQQITPLQGQFKRISQAIIDATESAGAGLFSDDFNDKVKKSTKVVKDWYDGWKKQMTSLATGTIVLGSFEQEVQKLVGDQGKLTIRPTVQVAPFVDTKGLAAQADSISGIIRDTIINGLASVGEVIGNLITGEKNPFAPLFNVIGGGIKALGKQMIQYAVLQKAMLASLSSLNPFLSAGVGIALIALGSVISNMGAVQKFASGGVVTQPTLALVGERGPERITPLGYEGSAGNMMQGAVQFVIRGQDLYGTLNRFNQNNRNIN